MEGAVTDVIEVAVGVGAPLILLAVVGPWRRRRAVVALVLGLLAVGGAMVAGVLVPGDLVALPGLMGLSGGVGALLAWGAFGGLAAAAGGLRLPGPAVLVAAVSGALLGELGAAAALAAVARDRQGAARLSLAAMGGALLGRIGDPALVLLGDRLPGGPLALAPLAVGMILIAAPRREHLQPGAGSWAVTVVAGATALAAVLLPTQTALVLGLGAAAMGGVAALRQGPRLLSDPALLGPLLWTAGGGLLALVATAGGIPGLAAQGIEEIVENLGHGFLPAAAGVSALLSALLDGPTASLLLTATLDRCLFIRGDSLALAVAAGAAAGGLGPLVVSGGLRAGALRWLLQVLLALAWVALVLR